MTISTNINAFGAIKASAQNNREEWLKIRRNGLGGSDIASVLGLSPYRSPLDVFLDKTGKTEPKEAGQAAYFGTLLEDMVATEFAKRTGMKIQKVNFILTAGENGWMRGNIDRAIINPDISKRVFVQKPEKIEATGRLLSTDVGLECKTANSFMATEWGESQEAEILAGNVVTDHKIPLYYETQIQWYMAVTGMSKFYVAVLIGGQDFRIYEVKRDQAVIDAIVSKCREFWFENVLKDVAPAPVNVSDILKIYGRDNGEMIEASNEQAADIGEYKTISEQIKSLESQKAAVASRIILAIGEKQGMTIGGKKAATYKTQESKRFSSTEFKKAEPELFEQYAKVTSTRVLRVS